jgi:hypothetical protein
LSVSSDFNEITAKPGGYRDRRSHLLVSLAAVLSIAEADDAKQPDDLRIQ